jgi:glycosyltransferase involved in cell wall biosynthesis
MDVARASLGIAPNRTVFVNHGRIGRFKGWELLIDALDLYRRKDPNALLLFVGDGEDGPPLQASIDARNLGSHVKITGFQKPNQVKAYLNAANVAVYGSFVEGWSAAMLEAIACGKPIVSTDVSGVKSMVVEGKNGFVVNTRNPAAFADAMERAIHLPDAEQISTSIAAGFNLAQQREKLTRLWAPFGGAGADRDITINHPAWTRSKNMTGSAAAS